MDGIDYLFEAVLEIIGGSCSEVAQDIDALADGLERDFAELQAEIEIPPEVRDALREACTNITSLHEIISPTEILGHQHDVLGNLVGKFSGGIIVSRDGRF